MMTSLWCRFADNPISEGSCFAAGYELFFEQSIRAGRILVGYLNGDIDIANTAIYSETSIGVGVNLDSAVEQGVEISADLIDMAGRFVEDGAQLLSQAEAMARIETAGIAFQQEFLAGLASAE